VPRLWTGNRKATAASLGVGLACGLALALVGARGWVLAVAGLAVALVWSRYYLSTWGTEEVRRRRERARERQAERESRRRRDRDE
jgi:hypothetical protein